MQPRVDLPRQLELELKLIQWHVNIGRASLENSCKKFFKRELIHLASLFSYSLLWIFITLSENFRGNCF